LWAPVINANELGEIQLVFDICVSAWSFKNQCTVAIVEHL
jgi:hypothetical protein